jgi:uncharacterized protein
VTALRREGDDLLLACKVQPRAKHNMFGEVRNGAVIVKLRAPPVDGKANDELVRFIADTFAVPISRIRIERGQNSRHKVLRIEGTHAIPVELSSLGAGMGG